MRTSQSVATRAVAVVLLTGPPGLATAQSAAATADLILTGARVRTPAGWVEGLAVRRGVIVAVGDAADTSRLPELPEGWCWATVDQLSVVVRGASPRPAGDPRYFGGTVPWITVGALTADEEPYLRHVSESLTDAGRRASRFVEVGTFLLPNSGATLGVPKISLIGGCINDGSVALLHVQDPTKLYLYFFLKTLTQKLRSINQGAAQPNLNTGIVRNISVSVPPPTEQLRIATDLERLLSVATAIEADVVAGRKRALRLRQAVLKWAFEGKLVDQDPNDEPAAGLFAHIRAERAVVAPTKKSRGRTVKGAA